MTVSTAMTFFTLILVVVSLWFMYCNTRTFKQRRAILHIIKEYSEYTIWQSGYEQYISVSYRQHMNCLLLCKNPWKLYKVKNNEQA